MNVHKLKRALFTSNIYACYFNIRKNIRFVSTLIFTVEILHFFITINITSKGEYQFFDVIPVMNIKNVNRITP